MAKNFTPLSIQAITGNPGVSTLSFEPKTTAPSTASTPSPIRANSTSVPVSQLSRPTPSTPTLTPPPIKSSVAEQITTLTAEAGRLQTKLDAQKRTEAKNAMPQQIIDLASQDLSGEKQTLRDEAGLVEKEEFARDLFNRMTERDFSYRDRIEAAEKNPDGKLRGALNAEINDLQVQRSRELTDLLFSYNIAAGDLKAAQATVDARILDMEAERNRKLNAYKTAYDMVQNDLSDSEQLQIQQSFQKDMNEVQFSQQKEMATFNDQLARERQAISDARADARAVTSAGGTLSGKPQTAGQVKMQGFAERLLDAEKTFDKLNLADFAKKSSFGGILPSVLQSGERRQFEQAKRNFVNGVLRQESGAAIAESEFKSAELQYFPQPGDDAGTLAQKERNRNIVITNLFQQSDLPRPASPGDIIESNGKTYQVGADGESLTEI